MSESATFCIHCGAAGMHEQIVRVLGSQFPVPHPEIECQRNPAFSRLLRAAIAVPTTGVNDCEVNLKTAAPESFEIPPARDRRLQRPTPCIFMQILVAM